MKDEENRIVFIDQCKAFGMVLVIVGHLSTPSYINSFIYSFHMPLFFILAGMTTNTQKILDSSLKDYAKKTVANYLIPYFWLQFTCLPLYFIRIQYLQGMDFSLMETCRGMIVGNARLYQFPVSATWFVLTMFLSRLIFAVIVKVSEGKPSLILILALICSLVSFTQKDIDYPWHYTVSFAAVLFLYFGNRMMTWYKNSGEELIKKLGFLKTVPIAALFLCIGLVCVLSNHGLSMNMNNFGHRDSILLYYAMSIFLSLALILFVIQLPAISFFCFVGRNTLLYMALQGELIKIVYQIFPSWQENYVISIMAAIALFVGIAPICAFVNSFFPYVVGRKSVLPPVPNRICRIACVTECSWTFYYVLLQKFDLKPFVLWGGVLMCSVITAFAVVLGARKMRLLWKE